MTASISPGAGKPAPASARIDVDRLVSAHHSEVPDPTVASQRVAFGTSGHRGSAFDRSFNEWHVLAITQAICRFVNVVDLMVLQPPSEHPHGVSDHAFDDLFTTDKPVIFAFHGYPAIIHKLTCRRRNHDKIHVRGYKEEGTTTTPFDMVVLNSVDLYQLALDAIRRIPRLAGQVEAEAARFDATIQRHKRYIVEHGDDMPEILDWRWSPVKTDP